MTAPAAGVVGDIPVRVGDRVTKSTVLTTVDDNEGLEVYVNVPVQQAPELRVGLPVRLVDDRGAVLGDQQITFVAPSVDRATQSVLAKAALDRADGLRHDQFVRVRLVWRGDRADGAACRRDAHQRPLLRVRRREGRRRRRSRASARWSSARSSATTTSCSTA